MKKYIIPAAALLTLAAATVMAQYVEPATTFEPVEWNEMRKENKDGSLTSEFHGKWINYNDGAKWNKIDLSLRAVGTEFVMDKAPFEARIPKVATGKMKFSNTNKWDKDEKKLIADAPIFMEKRWTGVDPVAGKVEGTSVVYAKALSVGDLIYELHEQELRSIVRMNSEPAGIGNVELPFTETYSDSLVAKTSNRAELSLTERDTGEGKFIEKGNRRIITKQALVWDSSEPRKSQKITVPCRKVGATTYCKKIIPRAFFKDAVFPVFTDTTSTFLPDANAETSSVDGFLTASGDSYANLRAATTAGAADDSSTTATVGIGYSGDPFLKRAPVLFDTSALGAVVVSTGTLKVISAGRFYGSNDSTPIALYGTNPTSNNALVVADWNIATKWITTKMSDTTFNIKSSWSGTAGTAQVYPLNASGIANISTTGVSKFGLMTENDGDNYGVFVSTARMEASFRTADYTGTDNDPVLSLTYAVALPPNPPQPFYFLMRFIPSAFAR